MKTPALGAIVLVTFSCAFAHIPIARWDTVPYQRIDEDHPLNVAVVAFSKVGIDRVEFTILGQGHASAAIPVYSMSLNPQTNTYEYWTTLLARHFTTNGPITVEARVYDADENCRDSTGNCADLSCTPTCADDANILGLGLNPLPLIVNSTGAFPQHHVWVSNDGTDDWNPPYGTYAYPYRSIGGAMQALQHNYGSVDGAIIHLYPDEHHHPDYNWGIAQVPGVSSTTEWVTITTDAGARNSTFIDPAPEGMFWPHFGSQLMIAFRGVSITNSGTAAIGSSGVRLWADDCVIQGGGRGTSGPHPFGDTTLYEDVYLTNCSISQVNQATTDAVLVRGITISQIADDSFQNVPLVVNCTVDDVDPDPIVNGQVVHTDNHADLWQHWGGNSMNHRDDNVIVYGLVGTNLKYDGIFIRGDVGVAWEDEQHVCHSIPAADLPPVKAQGMAFVNIYVDVNGGYELNSAWYRWVDHLLWWNCTIRRQSGEEWRGISISHDDYRTDEDCAFQYYDIEISNWSVHGCDFTLFERGYDSQVDYTGWSDNHFVHVTDSLPGTGNTQDDDMLNASGTPRLGSKLLRRFDPALTVPVDARNYERTYRADVGAFQSHIGWVQKAPANSPSARAYHAMAYDPPDGKIVLFGGLTANGDSDETWQWNSTTDSWTQRTAIYKPPAQHGHTMIGVCGPATVVGTYQNQLWNWVWHGQNSLWAIYQMPDVPVRQYGAATFDYSGLAYLFDGKASGQAVDDLWIFAENQLCEQLYESGPAPRWGHAIETCFEPENSPAILFGGRNAQQPFDDTWVFQGSEQGGMFRSLVTLDTRTSYSARGVMRGGGPSGWQELSPTASPSARSGAQLVNHVLFGGYGEVPGGGEDYLDDTWVLVDGDPPTWRQIDLLGPTARTGHAMAMDSDGNILLFGGETGTSQYSNETFKLVVDEE